MSICELLKGDKRSFFYSPQDKNMFLLTNVTFLQNNYMTKFKLCSKVIVEEMRGNVITLQPTRVV